VNEDPYRLYRYFDANGTLLYVGISGQLAQRDKSHISRSKWMQLTAGSTVERRKTLARVKLAERIAIETEHPIFNVAYNSTPEAKARMRAYLEAVGRPDLLRSMRKVPAIREPAGPRISYDTATLGFRFTGGTYREKPFGYGATL
jgi:hypothetical protein